MSSKEKIFKFRKHDRIGAIDAHDDSVFLNECFLEVPGMIECLADTARLERIILGRTGAGKTALIEMLKKQKARIKVIEPDNLSLQYLTNSPILRYLEDQKVHLDLFYKLLWKHIFLIEIIQLKFNSDQNTFSDWLEKTFAYKTSKAALKYLKDWSNSFFLLIEQRVIEIENQLTTQIANEVGINSDLVRAKMSGKDTISESEKSIFHIKAQEVVNKIQIEHLNRLIDDVSKELFSKSEPKFFLVIDKLDENWADSMVRYQLIRALFDVVRDFQQKFRSVKIVLAIREDLLHSVFSNVKKDGLQEQKYSSYYLKLKWSQKELIQVLDKRLQKLVQTRGFDRNFPVRKLYPDAIGNEPFSTYFVKRTLHAPRDVVDFFNACLEHAEGKEKIGAQIVKTAEGKYSKARLTALCEEWRSIYPNLRFAADLLKNFPKLFLISDIQKHHLDDFACAVVGNEHEDEFSKIMRPFFETGEGIETVNGSLVNILYKVGLVGIKTDTFLATSWSFVDSAIIGISDLKPNSKVEICPAFYRVLGVDGGN